MVAIGIASFIAALALILTLANVGNQLLLLLTGIPLVLILPGYTLITVLFQKGKFKLPELVAISTGLSIALTILSGLLLALTSWNLHANTWVILLSGLILFNSLIVALRLWKTSPKKISKKDESAFKFSPVQLILLALSAVIVIGAILLARQGALDEKTAGSTQLWVLPVESPNQPSTSIRLGVQSSELTVFSYRLEVQVEGNNVFQVPKIQLEPGQKWELTTDLKLDLSTVQEIKVLLYLLDNNDKVYRNVTLKLNTSTRK